MLIRTGRDLAAGGDAIGTAPDGRIVFVTGAAPEELVEVETVQENPTFLRARALRVLEAGRTRVAPPCVHYGDCGGCVLQHVDEGEQTRSKGVALLDAIARIGRLDLSAIDVAPPWRTTGSTGGATGYGYRMRARFAVAPSGLVGFRAGRSRDVVDVTHCLVLVPALERALLAIREAVKAGDRAVRSVEEVDVVASGEDALVRLPPGLQHLRSSLSGALGLRLASDRESFLEVEDEHGALLLSPDVFTQSNALGSSAMVRHVLQLLEGRDVGEVVELYSGSGNFTRALAKVSGRVRAFESSEAAVALAERTLRGAAEIASEDVEVALGRLASSREIADVILMNPPRIGASSEVIRLVGEILPRVLIYVSCSPATFARDTGRLARYGLELDHVRLFDLYPQTAHVEVIGRLVRRGER